MIIFVSVFNIILNTESAIIIRLKKTDYLTFTKIQTPLRNETFKNYFFISMCIFI